MGHINVLHGNIEESSVELVFHHKDAVRENNETVISEIESDGGSDVCWNKDIFWVPDHSSKNYYRTRIISYSTSFNSVWFDQEKVVSEFEDILFRLYWSSATMCIIPDIGVANMYIWKSRMYELGLMPVSKDEIPPPTTEWSRKEVDVSDSIQPIWHPPNA